MVIVTAAFIEDLPVTSFLELLVSVIEMTLSLRKNRIGPTTGIVGMTRGIFTSTTSKFNYTRRYIVNANFSGTIISNDELYFLARLLAQ